MRARKYKRGRRIKSVEELMRQRFVIHKPNNNPTFQKIYHIGWACSWQLRFVYRLIKAGELYAAKPMDKCNGGDCERHRLGAEPCAHCPFCDEEGNI